MSISIDIGDHGFTLLDVGLIGSIGGALIGAAATLAGLFFASKELREAARRYNEESEWRQADFLNSLVTQIHSDKNIALIFRVLDWREGPAVVPPDFLPLFDGAQVFDIDWERFVRSLVKHRVGREWAEPDMYTYRSCFDCYCSFIQRMSDDKRIAKLGYHQFADLKFFCERTLDPLDRAKAPDKRAKRMIREFIIEYYGQHTYDTIHRFANVTPVATADDDSPVGLDLPEEGAGAPPETADGAAEQETGSDIPPVPSTGPIWTRAIALARRLKRLTGR